MVNRFLNIALSSLQVIILILFLFIFDFSFLGCERKNTQSEDGMPKIWVTQLPAENYYCSPALSIDEKIVYFGTSALPDIHKKSQYFVALDAETGKEVWRLQLGINEVRSAPAISSDNSIYFTFETRDPLNGTIQGDELWQRGRKGEREKGRGGDAYTSKISLALRTLCYNVVPFAVTKTF
jgi:hypothetical protein